MYQTRLKIPILRGDQISQPTTGVKPKPVFFISAFPILSVPMDLRKIQSQLSTTKVNPVQRYSRKQDFSSIKKMRLNSLESASSS
jgi:hypothetical protein